MVHLILCPIQRKTSFRIRTNADALKSYSSGEAYQTIEVKALDLYDTGEATDRLGFMKMTHIISEPHGVNTWLLCTKAIIPLDKPAEKEFVLGRSRKKFSTMQASTDSVSNKGYAMSKSAGSYLEDRGSSS